MSGKGVVFSVRKKLSLDRNEIALIDNKKLPKWLDCNIINDVLVLQGIPSSGSEGEIIIQIIAID